MATRSGRCRHICTLYFSLHLLWKLTAPEPIWRHGDRLARTDDRDAPPALRLSYPLDPYSSYVILAEENFHQGEDGPAAGAREMSGVAFSVGTLWSLSCSQPAVSAEHCRSSVKICEQYFRGGAGRFTPGSAVDVEVSWHGGCESDHVSTYPTFCNFPGI
jgi:hypothetical protein